MNISTVNELIHTLESAGELSIREQKFLKLAKAYADKEAESAAQALTIEKCREVVGCPAGVDLQDHLRQLAAENAKLADCANFYRLGFRPVKGSFGVEYRPTEQLLDDCGNTAIEAIKTTATDRIVAGIKADGVEEFAESQKEYVRQHREMDQMLRAAYTGSAVDAERFAKQLREVSK